MQSASEVSKMVATVFLGILNEYLVTKQTGRQEPVPVFGFNP